MRHLTTFSLPCSFSMLRMALLLGFFLLCFGAENGLASQRVRGYSLAKYVLSGQTYVPGPIYYHYIIDGSSDSSTAFYEWWPFLSGLKHNYTVANSLMMWYPPEYPAPGYGNDPPFYYRTFVGSFFTASNVPDDWTQDDVNNANDLVSNLSQSQLAAITGTFVGANVTNGDTTTKAVSLNTKTPGSVVPGGGVVTYGLSGVPEVSYSDGYGVISGNRILPDGSTTPIYYTVVDGHVEEHSSYPISDYSNLQSDGDGNYTLSVPDYSGQLNQIITRIDNIDLHIPDINVNPEVTVNVPPPQVTVNPDINLTPEVTVNVPAPEVTVTIPDSISSSLGSISSSVSNIQSNVNVSGDIASMPSFDDLTLTSEEQSLVSRYSDWETNIPLIGDAVDFGLTALFGKLPTVGTEYVWLDYTIGSRSSSKASSKAPASSSVNPLNGYRILIDLTAYRDVLLAARGVMVIGEALLFLVLCYRDIKKALSV